MELNDDQKAGLKKAVEDAVALKSLLKHNGWCKVLEQRINARINDKHKVWLKAKTPEVAESLRQRVAGYEGVFDIIQKVLKEGQNAQNLLANPRSNEDNSQGEV